MKGHKLDGETHSKIEKLSPSIASTAARPRLSKVMARKAPWKAGMRLRWTSGNTPVDRSEPNNPAKMAKLKSDKGEEHKRGGHVKKRKEGGPVAGEWPKHSSARAPRKSGGYCEDSPFTTANKSTPAKGREVMRMSEGLDKE